VLTIATQLLSTNMSIILKYYIMNNHTITQSLKSTFAILTLCIGLSVAFTSCTQEKGKEMSKEETLVLASKLNASFADKVITANTVRGFAAEDKGRKDSLVLIADALKVYNYDDVIKLSNEYFINYDSDENVKYMLATALFQKGEYGKAAKHYIPLLQSTGFEEKRTAKYYLALCNMRFDSESGNKTALKYLNQLKSDPGEEFTSDHLQGLIDVCS